MLALDPGAERMGWAVLEGDHRNTPQWIASGIWTTPRADEDFQPYKLRLIKATAKRAEETIGRYMPNEVVAEIIPAVGGGNFVAATQSYLANTAVTVVLGMAEWKFTPIFQVGATTVKKNIGGSKKATKIRIRNAVYDLYPFLRETREELWKKIHDESDAIGVGLTHLGYCAPKA